ncbi:MAG: citrate synthase [Gemmatimonadales bacterium]|nr:citrate synthase [Gemmatimonadales bacterium]MYG49099.1 citrate synthase [Gemmatimonadales bacterium]MYK02838.1 citrate synthase [Candidatus Palauibacter ramosifaciens]
MTAAAGKGLEGVVASQTSLSFIDGLKGILVYRGYNIHELAPHVSFPESVFLLWNGRLPRRSELAEFEAALAAQRALDPRTVEGLKGLPAETVPMAALRTGVSLEGVYDPDAEDNSSAANRRKAERLVARTPTIIAAIQRIRQGLEPLEPDPSLSLSADFVRMANGEVGTEEAVDALDRTLFLYLDHGFNASTFACRVIAATLGDMHSAVTGGVGALKGELHGGANARAMHTLLEIGDTENVEPWLDRAFAEKRKIMGFGHRVYKTEDPRATHLREMSRVLTQQAGLGKFYEMSRELEGRMIAEKGINPNVDFYCATVYYALGIPIDLYTALFAMGRMGGWTAHVMEQHADNRLIRPRAEYVGETDLRWVPMDER